MGEGYSEDGEEVGMCVLKCQVTLDDLISRHNIIASLNNKEYSECSFEFYKQYFRQISMFVKTYLLS